MNTSRKDTIKKRLLESKEPITATDLAAEFSVSRQTIVGDIALLRAQGEKIIATSRGYEYEPQHLFEETIVCRHFPDQTKQELQAIVAAHAIVKDVSIDHQVYGQLTGRLQIRNDKDIDLYLKKMTESHSRLLLELTEGVHSHTLAANNLTAIEKAKENLKKLGILYQG